MLNFKPNQHVSQSTANGRINLKVDWFVCHLLCLLHTSRHIHESPVEIISQPHGSPVISISAPALADGFNAIEIVFTPLGIPLTCRIMPWRFDGSGVLQSHTPIAVSLLNNRRRSTNATLGQFFAKLMQHGQCYWSDILNYATEIDAALSDTDVVEMIELLAADQSIVVENYDLPCNQWLVRAEI